MCNARALEGIYSWCGCGIGPRYEWVEGTSLSTYKVKRSDLPSLHTPQSISVLLLLSITIIRRHVAANKQRRGRVVVRSALRPYRSRLLARFLRGRREEASYGAFF